VVKIVPDTQVSHSRIRP